MLTLHIIILIVGSVAGYLANELRHERRRAPTGLTPTRHLCRHLPSTIPGVNAYEPKWRPFRSLLTDPPGSGPDVGKHLPSGEAPVIDVEEVTPASVKSPLPPLPLTPVLNQLIETYQ